MKKRFTVELTARGPNGAWTFFTLPFSVEETFGTKARLPVKGTINGEPFTSSAMPAGDGTHALAVSKALQAAARASAGDRVTVVLEPDLEPRTVDVPAELQAAFADAQKAHAAFSALAYSHQKEYVSWIASAKRPATRERRIAQAIEMLTSGKTLSR
jgi:UDP-N-acetylmuramate-alanine ligase